MGKTHAVDERRNHQASHLITISTEERGGAVIVRVDGEVDIASAPRLEAELTRLIRQGWSVVLDAGAITYFDMAGVRALESVARLAGRNGELVMAGLSHPVARVVEIVAAAGPVPRFATVEEALAHLRRERGPA